MKPGTGEMKNRVNYPKSILFVANNVSLYFQQTGKSLAQYF